MSKRTRSSMRPTRVRRARETLRLLAELYPAVFASDGWLPHRPLAIGIDAGLRGLLTPAELRTALRIYTHRRMYLISLIGGGCRFDLQGNICGEVTADQIEDAKLQLARIDATREDRAMNAKSALQAARQARREAQKSTEIRTQARRSTGRPAASRTVPPPAPLTVPPEKTPARLSSASVGRLSLAELRERASARRASVETAA